MKNACTYILNKLITFNQKFEIYRLNHQKVKLFQHNDASIEYCSVGKGAPLILIVGYGATLCSWDIRFLSQLSKQRQVIVFNNRNTGNSIHHEESYTISDLANDIEKLRSGLKFEKIDLCGISLGGAIAQQYASEYPEYINHLILINSFPPGDLLTVMDDKTIKIVRKLNNKNPFNLWRKLGLLLPSPLLFYRCFLYRFRPLGANRTISSATLEKQRDAILGWKNRQQPLSFLEKITCPVLILGGERDVIVPINNAQTLACQLANATLIKFANGRHLMIYQYPQQIANLINKFITSELIDYSNA